MARIIAASVTPEQAPASDSREQPAHKRRAYTVPVVDPAGELHHSVTAAARAHGLHVSTIWRRCYLGRAGWRLAVAAPDDHA